MQEMIHSQTGYDLIYLVGCALGDTPPNPERVLAMDLPGVRALARAHCLSALACLAAERGLDGAGAQEDLLADWRREKFQALRKNLLLREAYRDLSQALDEQGIWHLPLKGISLPEDLPGLAYRETADMDLLCDPARLGEVRDLLRKLGCTPGRQAHGKEESFFRPPVVHLELHSGLFAPPEDPRLVAFSDRIPQRMRPLGPDTRACTLTDEDAYLYFIAHAGLHLANRGTGLRTLADCFAWLRARGSNMDWAYLRRELEQLGMTDLERSLRELSLAVFADPEAFCPEQLTAQQTRLLTDLLSSGAYGTLDRLVRRRLADLEIPERSPVRVKLRYVRNRLFPGRAAVEAFCPLVRRHPWLLPAGTLWRIIAQTAAHPDYVLRQVRALRRHSARVPQRGGVLDDGSR